MDRRTSIAVEFRLKPGFKQHDVMLKKEWPISTRIMKAFTSEKILLQHYVLGYQIDLYFPEHKVAK